MIKTQKPLLHDVGMGRGRIIIMKLPQCVLYSTILPYKGITFTSQLTVNKGHPTILSSS